MSKHFVHGTQNREQGFPNVGDTVEYAKTVGYRLYQDRPFDCRRGPCKCEKNCDGVTSKYTAKVARVASYMDNSYEVTTDLGHMVMWEYPHGDVC